MDASIDIDYTTARFSDLQHQMIRSFQFEDDHCVQTNNTNDCQQTMIIFILQQKLHSIQSKYIKLEIENQQLKQDNAQKESIIDALQNQIILMEQRNKKHLLQVSNTKNQIKINLINRYESAMNELSTQFEHHLNEYENQITNLSQQIIHCKMKYDEKILKIEDEWQSKYSRLTQKFKTSVIEDEWRLKYLKLEREINRRQELISNDHTVMKARDKCDAKHECNWFGHCHYAPAIILLIILVILLIVWNKCVQFVKKLFSLCRKVVCG